MKFGISVSYCIDFQIIVLSYELSYKPNVVQDHLEAVVTRVDALLNLKEEELVR